MYIIGNVTAQSMLREYGLLNTMPFVLKNLTEIYDSEHLHEKPEINIEHYGNVLVKFVNCAAHYPLEKDVISFDIGDMLEFIRAETCKSQVMP
jgi:hypothetical protein